MLILNDEIAECGNGEVVFIGEYKISGKLYRFLIPRHWNLVYY